MSSSGPTNGGGGGVGDDAAMGLSGGLAENMQQQQVNVDSAALVQDRKNTGQDVCRDFLNNVCFRGSRCKYYHPPSVAQKDELSHNSTKVMFCKDYVNQVCYRGSCKYVHCTREEKGQYEQTGRITESLARAIVAATGQDVIDGRPLCKEYLSNHCSRGSRCRFWHISPKQEREMRMIGIDSAPPTSLDHCMVNAVPPQPNLGYRASFDTMRDLKRRSTDDDLVAVGGGSGGGSSGTPPPYHRARFDGAAAAAAAAAGTAAVMNNTALCEEIVSLRSRLDMMKQSLVDLMSQNDHLITENALLRSKLTAANISDSVVGGGGGGPPAGMMSMNSMITNNSPPVTASAKPADRWSMLH